MVDALPKEVLLLFNQTALIVSDKLFTFPCAKVALLPRNPTCAPRSVAPAGWHNPYASSIELSNSFRRIWKLKFPVAAFLTASVHCMTIILFGAVPIVLYTISDPLEIKSIPKAETAPEYAVALLIGI